MLNQVLSMHSRGKLSQALSRFSIMQATESWERGAICISIKNNKFRTVAIAQDISHCSSITQGHGLTETSWHEMIFHCRSRYIRESM